MRDALPAMIGKYPIVRTLGSGATSNVYLAEDRFSGRRVAIKVIHRDPTADAESRRRIHSGFLNEAALTGKLHHPHIVSILDAVNDAEQCYIVMEYVAGGTLEQYCSYDALLPIERVVELVFKTGLALAYAQRQGVIHCDIKPGNLLLASDTEPKISDFGAAHYAAAEHTYLMGIGSPSYMSPEQVQDKQLNHQTDIYSLGVVLYKLLTGKLPFLASHRESLLYQIVNIDPPPPSTHRAGIPAELDRIVLRALAKSREQRYGQWQEFADDLVRSFRHLSVPEQDLSGAERFNALRRLPLFRDFGDVEIWEALRIGQWRQVPADTTLVREGDPGEAMYVLLAGEVLVTRAGYALETLALGQCFGELLYFEASTTRRTTTIAATTAVTVMEVKARALARASPACQMHFNQAFLRVLVKRVERIQGGLAPGRRPRRARETGGPVRFLEIDQ